MRSTVQTIVTARVQVIRQNRVVVVAGTAGCGASLRYHSAPTGKPGIKGHEPKGSSFSSDPTLCSCLTRMSTWDRLPGSWSSWQ